MKIERIAERIASLGLIGSSNEPIDIDGVDPEALLRVLNNERILGLFVSGCEAGAIDAEPEQIALITAAHDEAMSQSMRIEIAALRVSTLLEESRIDHRLLKGAGLAHTIARTPSERSFRDVDLLVPSTEISRAVSLLMREGADRLQPELRPGYDTRFAKSVTMRIDGVEIDLHRTLCPGPFGVWMRPNDLFLLRDTVSIGNQTLTTLDRTNHLIHACYHVALGQVVPVLANLRDIALLATSGDALGYDVERFDDTIRRWKGRAVIRRAVRLAQNRLDAELPESLSGYLHEPAEAAELAAIDPYLTNDPAGRFAALAPSTLRALPMSDRAAYALAVGLPDGTSARDRVSSLLHRNK